MPRLLRQDAVRLLEASREALTLALGALSAPRVGQSRDPASRWAPVVGLIGAAAELALSACLVQVFGKQALLVPGSKTRYKSAPEILRDFRALVRLGNEAPTFLVQGVSDPESHRQSLLSLAEGFKPLFVARAGGLHGGIGPPRDVCIVLATQVLDFLQLLGQSERIRPYVQDVPEWPHPVREPQLIVEDIRRRLSQATSLEERTALLSGLFLVMVPDEDMSTDWLTAFERVTITPRKQDVIYYVDVLSRASPVSLVRVSGSERGIPVRIDREDPFAVPVLPQFIKRTFTQMSEQWHADVGNANGRLDQGVLDLPPSDFVLDLFSVGLDSLELTPRGRQLTAHQTWPFICSSLNTPGTPGPCWFLIRRTSDLSQLLSYLRRAASIGSERLRTRVQETEEGIEALIQGKPLDTESNLAKWIVKAVSYREARQEQLLELLQRHQGSDREASQELSDGIKNALDGETSIGDLLVNITKGSYSFRSVTGRKYWARVLAECACEPDDVTGLVMVLKDGDLGCAHTAARAGVRLIDLLSFGPSIDAK